MLVGRTRETVRADVGRDKMPSQSWEGIRTIHMLLPTRCLLLNSRASFASFARVVLDTGSLFLCMTCNGMHQVDHEIRDRNCGKWSRSASSSKRLILSALVGTILTLQRRELGDGSKLGIL
jgi:hypothetical protein